MTRSQRFALLWARIYTAPLPREVRDTRRAEIVSDVTEPQPAGPRLASRVVRGMLADIAWACARLPAEGRQSLGLLIGMPLLLASSWAYVAPRLDRPDGFAAAIFPIYAVSLLAYLGNPAGRGRRFGLTPTRSRSLAGGCRAAFWIVLGLNAAYYGVREPAMMLTALATASVLWMSTIGLLHVAGHRGRR